MARKTHRYWSFKGLLTKPSGAWAAIPLSFYIVLYVILWLIPAPGDKCGQSLLDSLVNTDNDITARQLHTVQRLSATHVPIYFLSLLYWVVEWPRWHRKTIKNGILVSIGILGLIIAVVTLGLLLTLSKSGAMNNDGTIYVCFRKALGQVIVQFFFSLTFTCFTIVAVVRWTWFLAERLKSPNNFMPVVKDGKGAGTVKDGIAMIDLLTPTTPLEILFAKQQSRSEEISLDSTQTPISDMHFHENRSLVVRNTYLGRHSDPWVESKLWYWILATPLIGSWKFYILFTFLEFAPQIFTQILIQKLSLRCRWYCHANWLSLCLYAAVPLIAYFVVCRRIRPDYAYRGVLRVDVLSLIFVIFGMSFGIGFDAALIGDYGKTKELGVLSSLVAITVVRIVLTRFMIPFVLILELASTIHGNISWKSRDRRWRTTGEPTAELISQATLPPPGILGKEKEFVPVTHVEHGHRSMQLGQSSNGAMSPIAPSPNQRPDKEAAESPSVTMIIEFLNSEGLRTELSRTDPHVHGSSADSITHVPSGPSNTHDFT